MSEKRLLFFRGASVFLKKIDRKQAEAYIESLMRKKLVAIYPMGVYNVAVNVRQKST